MIARLTVIVLAAALAAEAARLAPSDAEKARIKAKIKEGAGR